MDDYEMEENEGGLDGGGNEEPLTFGKLLDDYVEPAVLILLSAAGVALNAVALAVLRRKKRPSGQQLDGLLSTVALAFLLSCAQDLFLRLTTGQDSYAQSCLSLRFLIPPWQT